MATDVDAFKKKHDKALARVMAEVDFMLPSEMSDLADMLEACRDSYGGYDFVNVHGKHHEG